MTYNVWLVLHPIYPESPSKKNKLEHIKPGNLNDEYRKCQMVLIIFSSEANRKSVPGKLVQ